MSEGSVDKKASGEYEKAYTAHYKSKKLEDAIARYQNIIKSHPKSKEAGYARAQLLNIVNHVVSPEELLNAQVEMALARLKKKD